MTPKHITIIGAGLVGSLLSVMLAKRGYGVTIFEKRPDLRQSTISAGRSINLALAERGIGPLTEAGLMDDVHPQLVPMRGRMLHLPGGGLEFQPYGQRPQEVIYSVSRGELNKLMMSAAERTGKVDLQFLHSCQQIDFEEHRIQMRNERTGETRWGEFDLLIGADGAGSIVRQALVAARGGSSSIEFLDHGYKELCIPSDEEGGHRMQREALHIWPRGGYMLIALPNSDGSFTVTLFLNEKTPAGENPTSQPSFASLCDDQQVISFFQRQFPDALELIPDLAEEFARNPTGPLGTVRCDTWNVDATALILGDASHAIVPFHGQGMNAGFEDCSELLGRLDQADGDWTRAISDFVAQRPPNANAIADMALENYVIMRDSVRDPKFQLKNELGFALERQFPQRFIPRYSMVMFHRLPYAQALQRGHIQNEILDQLTRTAKSVAEVNMQQASTLVQSRLDPLEID